MLIKQTEATLMRVFPQDKCLHVIAGAVVFTLAHLLFLLGVSFCVPLVCVVIVALIGALKELLDYFDGGDPSFFDWLATTIGGLIGLVCAISQLAFAG